jgi:hypothetical protein
MATLHEDVKAAIASATSSILTGGIFDSNEIYGDDAVDGGGYQWAIDNDLFESDGMTLISHGIMRWGENNAYQSEHPKLAAEREFLTIWLYEDMGYEDIDAAKVAIKTALHDQYFYPTGRGLAHLLYATFSPELKAPEYANKPMKFVRFSIVGR